MDNEEEQSQQQLNEQAPRKRERKKSLHDKYKDTVRVIKTTTRIVRLVFNPAFVWIFVGVTVFIALYMLLFSGTNPLISTPPLPPPEDQTNAANPLPPGLSIVVTARDQVANGENIEYNVQVSYEPTLSTSPIENIIVYDTLPQHTEFVSATAPCEFRATVVDCPLANQPNQINFTIVLRPTKENIVVTNTINARLVVGNVPIGGQEPSQNTCNQTYDISRNPLQANFGDPVCNFNKDQLYSLLQLNDPENANFWFYKIVPCESSYNPNAYLDASASGMGAYGLFQMNPTGKGNGQYDAGDVPWQNQTTNAIRYNKDMIKESFAYWHCAQ